MAGLKNYLSLHYKFIKEKALEEILKLEDGNVARFSGLITRTVYIPHLQSYFQRKDVRKRYLSFSSEEQRIDILHELWSYKKELESYLSSLKKRAGDYYAHHRLFIEYKCFQELHESIAKADFKPEVRPLLAGLPAFLFRSMHYPYIMRYLLRESTQKVYATLTQEEQQKDLLRVMDYYYEQRMKAWREHREKKRISGVN